MLEARAFGGCSNLDDRGIAGDSGGSPGSFARIRRSIFIRRDVGYWSPSIVPVRRFSSAPVSSSVRSSCMLAEARRDKWFNVLD